jgi:hypothetical protein
MKFEDAFTTAPSPPTPPPQAGEGSKKSKLNMVANK